MRSRQRDPAETGCIGVHDPRPQSSTPGRRPLDIETLRARVAYVRARLGFDDDGGIVDADDEPTDGEIPDWAEVEQVMGGLRRRGASPAAKRIAVQRLTRRGLSAREIGQRIGMTERSVVRYRAGGAP